MKWPLKKTDKSEQNNVTDLAKKEIEKTQDRLSRIDKIVLEAHRAEITIQRRRGV